MYSLLCQYHMIIVSKKCVIWGGGFKNWCNLISICLYGKTLHDAQHDMYMYVVVTTGTYNANKINGMLC